MTTSSDRVLVVDDEQDVRDMMCCFLEAEGYQAWPVPDGAAALRAAISRAFDLATMDLRMPGMSGVETLGHLKRLAPEVGVVVVSGYVTPADARACLALGAFAILQKPVDLEELLRALDAAKGTRTRHGPHVS